MHTHVQCMREHVCGSGEGRRVQGECARVCTCVSGRLSGGAPGSWDPGAHSAPLWGRTPYPKSLSLRQVLSEVPRPRRREVR